MGMGVPRFSGIQLPGGGRARKQIRRGHSIGIPSHPQPTSRVAQSEAA